MAIFENYFSQLSDIRQQGKVKHLLTDIIGLSLLAVISGAESYEDIEDYGVTKDDWLKKYLSLPHGIPSHDTIERVMEAINPKEFSIYFTQWVKDIFNLHEDFLIHVDGKSNRRSHDSFAGTKMLHALNAYAGEHHLTLAQMRVADKSNEITAIPELLKLLDIKGHTITIDAMGCQQQIARQIAESKSYYVLAVKGNQQHLYDEIGNAFSHLVPSASHRTTEKSHGRIEERTCSVIQDLRFIDDDKQWEDLKSVVRVESKRTVKDISTHETRYYISNHLKDATFFQHAIRSHWSIENELHYVLDVGFNEDYCRKREKNAAENFNIIRKMALNILRSDKSTKSSLKRKRKSAGWNNDYLKAILEIFMR
jgi:predicted transposase YbfD/YdcC